LERTVAGKEVTIIGVQHDGENFEKHREFYAEKIAENDAVVLEAGTVDLNSQAYTPCGLQEGLYLEFSKFFGPILDIAMESKKRVFIADPSNEPMLHRGWKIEKILTSQRIAEGLIAGACLALTGGVSGSRATFYAGLALDFVSIAAIAVPGHYSHPKIPPLVKLSHHDYRDIKIAQGIGSMCEKGEEQRILAIHGEAHSRGISFYLDHPKLASLKLGAYFLLEMESKRHGTDKAREVKEIIRRFEIPDEVMRACPELYLYPDETRDFQQLPAFSTC
jgi:hypothetical protein